MKRCLRCGFSNNEEDKFCACCGINLEKQQKETIGTQQTLKASDIRFNLGIVYFKENKFVLAMQTFAGILEKDPGNSQAQHYYDLSSKANDENNLSSNI